MQWISWRLSQYNFKQISNVTLSSPSGFDTFSNAFSSFTYYITDK